MKKVNLWQIAWGFVFIVVLSVGCKKKTPAPTPPPPPPPAAKPAPTVTLNAEPSTVQRGGSSTLRWSSQNATDLSIEPGVGRVDASGSKSVSPSDSTTYTITARGDGGTANATTRITVTAPPPPPAPKAEAPVRQETTQEKFERAIKDAYFDFDKADIRDDARTNLTSSADFLRTNSGLSVTIEGHCDERGSVAYNLGLGDRRAAATKEFLVSLGISADRIKTISYGKERPFCTEKDESCMQQNRRGHVVCDNCGN